MPTITFEFHGQLLRLAGAGEYAMTLAQTTTVGDALAQLAGERPELAGALARCACAIGDRLALRRETLHGDERLALLPPVAGG
jgi:molybdopterin synthase sulfur carrier subunit